MDNTIFIEAATEDTPEYIIDKNNNIISITGISMPENSFDFFDPLEKKTMEAFLDHKGDLALNIELSYLNSMSSKQLLKIIKLLSSRHSGLKVTWKYLAEDDLIRMKGEEIKEICSNVKIDLVELNN